MFPQYAESERITKHPPTVTVVRSLASTLTSFVSVAGGSASLASTEASRVSFAVVCTETASWEER